MSHVAYNVRWCLSHMISYMNIYIYDFIYEYIYIHIWFHMWMYIYIGSKGQVQFVRAIDTSALLQSSTVLQPQSPFLLQPLLHLLQLLQPMLIVAADVATITDTQRAPSHSLYRSLRSHLRAVTVRRSGAMTSRPRSPILNTRWILSPMPTRDCPQVYVWCVCVVCVCGVW